MNERSQKIQARLLETFKPISCQLQDDSASHAGHAGAASGGSHYSLRIVSQKFDGLNRISRHRLVYDAVGDMMHTEIHALVIVALTPSEMPT
jgi:BolA protein